MALDTMQVAALGRPFGLGMLYDARKDEALPGLKLWENETLQSMITDVHKPFSNFEIAASDSIDQRSSLLNVGASLKASFLGGLIKVGGSARYLNDKKEFKNQSRVTCQYHATTNFKELAVTQLKRMDSHQIDIIKKSSATHVVTGILYGAKAFFVFDSEKLESSSVEEMQGSMEAVIKKIPKFGVQGKVDMKLSDEEKALTNKFSCKFYGDFILEQNPTNFEEAVKTYADLPELLRKNSEKGVPLKVWLMPVKMFVSEAAELKADLSAGLVRKAEDAFEDLSKIEMRCNDSQVDRAVEDFPEVQRELKRFQNLCNYYRLKLQKALTEKLPLIREGKEDESSVLKILEDGEKSPFSFEKLSKWLDYKEREINVIGFCVDTMKEVKIVHSQSQLDREVLAPGVDHALCFVFTSLESDDSNLDVMEGYLDSKQLARTNEDPWYYSSEAMNRMREKARIVDNLAKALKKNTRFRFLVADIDNKKYKGATLYHYKEGYLVTDDFIKPGISTLEKITDKSDLMWYATDVTLDPNTADYNLTLSEGNKKAMWGGRQDYSDHPERFDEYPQVLCTEGLSGQHYWEAEWSNGPKDSVYLIFGYKGIQRKGKGNKTELGQNTVSWAFGKRIDQNKLKAYHNGLINEQPAPPEGCNRIGVYLDYPGGTLSFYRVSANTLRHLYTFENKFTEPLYPGIWVWRDSSSVHFNLAE